ncbi:MAG TPA: AI-2E family transporter [Candidatus Paceibacterota bacterium]|nr:AI-2E family transporter [Candidatus Paceibacterota bacterium]
MTDTPAGRYFLLALIVGMVALAFFIVLPLLTPVLLGAIGAVVVQPAYQFLLRSVRWRGIAALLTILLTLMLVVMPIALIVTYVAGEARDVYATLITGEGRAWIASTIQSLEEAVQRYVPGVRNFSGTLSTNLSAYAETALSWFISHAGGAFSGIASFVLSFFIFLIAFFYFLKDGEGFRRWIIEISPLRDIDDRHIFERLGLAVNSVVRGNILIALIQGTMSGIGFCIFGVPYAALWGTLAAFGAMLPGVGTGLVFIPIVGYMLLTGSFIPALGLTVWGFTAVGLVDNFLGPRLIGSGIKLHPLLVLVAVLGGIALFGPIGIFLGPLSLSLLAALLSIYAESVRDS